MATDNKNSLLNKEAALKGEKAANGKSPGTNGSLNRRRRLKNETQGRGPAAPKNEKSLVTRLQEAKRQTSEGQLRVFAGETHEQARTRANAGNRGVRPEQVAITTGGSRGQSTVGITGPTSGRGTRGGLAIN